jgi:hypothetical protein
MKKKISAFVFLMLSVCAAQAQSKNPISVNIPGDSITFVIVGDYGQDNDHEKDVADMIKKWSFDFIITMGDNNYFLGSKRTIKNHIGKYYGDYIYNPDAPRGQVCSGKAAQDKVNRFFPCPGNHDNYTKNAKPYFDYFTLPGDESNYEFNWGPVHFYSMNTGKEGDVPCCETTESKWLKTALEKTTEPFKFVYFHHPPYSPGSHGSATKMQWPFAQWGLDAVLCGHEHFYAHVHDKTTPRLEYIISGNGGNEKLYGCDAHPLDPSRFEVKCDSAHWGAMLVTVTKQMAVFKYYTVNDPAHATDTYIIRK